MNFLKKILIIFFFLIPSSISLAQVTYVQQAFVTEDAGSPRGHIQGIHFNTTGDRMFVIYRDSNLNDGKQSHINAYNLSTPFDVSTKTYAGDDQRCTLNDGSHTTNGHGVYDLEFSSDGMKFFFVSSANGTNTNAIYHYKVSNPYDLSTCEYVEQNTNLGSTADPNLQNGSNAGDMVGAIQKNRPQGLEINDDGTKIFVIYHGHGNFGDTVINTRLLEYDLSTPYSLSTMSLVTDAGIELEDECANPMGIRFSNDGKRLWCVEHGNAASDVVQISLDVAYSTSSFTIDGEVRITNFGGNANLSQPRGIAFSQLGLKMYIGSDRTINGGDEVVEFDLDCPFNIISSATCQTYVSKGRTSMAEAQAELAKRTINLSTNSALNRLKWIRRNKDKQNLTNLNIDINFTNQRLASLTEVVKASASKVKKKNKDEDVFYWSEGSIAIGKIGDTSISSTKKIDTDAITFGADKFTEENGIQGLAFRVGRNNVDVGTGGSNLDTDTFNITYYSTSPIEDDTKFLDTFIGIGKLKSDLLTVLEGKKFTANRTGKQIYGTIRLKDEIKKDNFTFIPSGRFDIGHTILGSYKEVGTGGIDVEKQHLRTKKIRAGFAAVQDLSDDEYTLKRHGKIEYVIDIDRSSNFKYTYTGDNSVSFSDTLHSGALHNINGEIGLDIVFQDNFSLFLIYERNQALGSGHTDKVHIAIGYLPNKETNYAFSITGEDNLKSNYVLSKKINDYLIDFKLTNNAMRPEEFDEASINLLRKF